MTRSVPHRTCVGCRRRAPATELVRLRWTRAGLELIFKERPPGTDEHSGMGYAGLLDEGPLNQLEGSGFFDQMRAEYRR